MAERLVSEEHVLDDVQVVAQGEVLIDRRDPERLRIPRAVEVNGLPVPEDLPPSGAHSPEIVLIVTDLPAPLSPVAR